jgi:hypothetical protein
VEYDIRVEILQNPYSTEEGNLIGKNGTYIITLSS